MIVSYENFCLAREIHDKYSLKPYSKHIATLSALACLAQLLSDRKPTRVIEIGAGIGTMTELMLRHDDGPPLLAAYETDPRCLEALRELADCYWNYTPRIHSDPADLPALCDLLIVDGGAMNTIEWRGVRPGTAVLFEGNRVLERYLFKQFVGANGWSVLLHEEKLEMRQESVPGKGCWIGVVRGHETENSGGGDGEAVLRPDQVGPTGD